MISNFNKISDLVKFFESQQLYTIAETKGYIYNLFDHPYTLALKTEYLNDKFNLKTNDQLLPIFHCNADNYICILENKIYYINSEYSLDEAFESEYSTPQEVWEKVIKPDIELVIS